MSICVSVCCDKKKEHLKPVWCFICKLSLFVESGSIHIPQTSLMCWLLVDYLFKSMIHNVRSRGLVALRGEGGGGSEIKNEIFRSTAFQQSIFFKEIENYIFFGILEHKP